MLNLDPVKIGGVKSTFTPRLAPDTVDRCRHGASQILRRHSTIRDYAAIDDTMADLDQLEQLHDIAHEVAARHRKELLALERAVQVLETGEPDLASKHPVVRTCSDLVIRAKSFDAVVEGSEIASLTDIKENLSDLLKKTQEAAKTTAERLPKARDAIRRASLMVAAKTYALGTLCIREKILDIGDPYLTEILGTPGEGRIFNDIDPRIENKNQVGWTRPSIDNGFRNTLTASNLLRREADKRKNRRGS